MKKRALSLLLALCMTLSLAPATLAAESFSDVGTSHWAYDDIQTCADQDIVAGFSDGTFHPEDSVTYAQLISMLTRTFYSEEVRQVADTAGKPWYYPYMQVSRDHDLDFKTNIVNYGGWPVVAVADTAVNRYEMSSILRRVMSDHGKTVKLEEWQSVTGSIKDYGQIPPGDDNQIYYLTVPACYYAGILTGMSDGCFHGEQTMTRAQACAVMVRMMNLLDGETPSTQPTTPTQPATPTQPQQPTVGPVVPTPAQKSNGKLANGKDATVENVLDILDDIKLEFPTGTIWGEKNVPGNHYYTKELGNTYTGGVRDVGLLNAYFRSPTGALVDLTYACGGWAAMVSERIFGKTDAPCREVTDVNDVRPGDIVIYLDANGKTQHFAIVRWLPVFNEEYQLPEVYFCHGNMNGKVHWPDEDVANGVQGFVGTPVGPGGRVASGFKSGTHEVSYSDYTYYRFFTRYPE